MITSVRLRTRRGVFDMRKTNTERKQLLENKYIINQNDYYKYIIDQVQVSNVWKTNTERENVLGRLKTNAEREKLLERFKTNTEREQLLEKFKTNDETV